MGLLRAGGAAVNQIATRILTHPRETLQATWKQWWSHRRLQKIALDLLTLVVLGSGAYFVLIPLIWMITRSFMRLEDAMSTRWIPNPFTLEAYYKIFVEDRFYLYIRNTAFVTIMGVIGATLSSALVAYGFAFFRFWGRTALFMILLSTIMLPGEVTMIPIYRIFYQLGWVNTFLPLFVPSFFAPAFFVFLLRQFFMSIPQDLIDAARIDGASSFRIWWQIVLPLSRPALLTVIVFSFVGHWNDLLNPLIYISDSDKYTLSLALLAYKNLYFNYVNAMMAATLVTILPCVLLYFLAQRAFTEGIITTGLRG
jgi:ABC-type glycerol-3-phosphate transport system permease component